MRKIIALCIVLSLMVTVSVNAQKLPDIQETSMRAPAAIKIDGKKVEWDNLIQAFNKATGIFYTISNDNSDVYLVVKVNAKDLDISNKIINAGLTFTINGSGKAKNESGMSITFPFLYKEDHRPNLPLIDYNKEISVWNKQFTDKAKDIRVAGIAGIKDTISIYNPEGIKVVALFGEDAVFTYELAIPLKYLELSVNDPHPFVYSIKLNGTANYPYNLTGMDMILTQAGPVPAPTQTPPEFRSARANQVAAIQHVRSYLRGGIKGMRFEGGNYILDGPTGNIVMGLISPTYFSGEYTLAK